MTALPAPAVVAALACGLIAWEPTQLAEARGRVRHAGGELS